MIRLLTWSPFFFGALVGVLLYVLGVPRVPVLVVASCVFVGTLLVDRVRSAGSNFDAAARQGRGL